MSDQYKTQCMQTLENWVQDQGFLGINVGSLNWALHNRHSLSHEQEAGLNFWLADFRKLFFG